MIPTDYAAWRDCIERHCRIPLTREFIEQRLSELDDPKVYSTGQLLRVYGPEHVQRVREWFARARAELPAA